MIADWLCSWTHIKWTSRHANSPSCRAITLCLVVSSIVMCKWRVNLGLYKVCDRLWEIILQDLKQATGCWRLIWPLKFLTSTKYTFLKLLGHEDSSGVCSFVQSHPYFFTIVRAFSFQLKLAYFPWISKIFKNMLLGRDGFGKKHVCHVILYTLRISKYLC